MKVKKFHAPPLEENSYILYSENSRTGYIIDPGSKPDEILNFTNKNNLNIKAILNTHGHFDHTVFNQYLSNKLNLPVLLDEQDMVYTKRIKDFSYLFDREIVLPEEFIRYTDKLHIDNEDISIIKTPGHTPGGYSYYIPSQSMIFTGDTLFKGAFGRYDLPNGNFDDLKRSIKKLFELPDNTIVYSGHGEETTIGEEKKTNYILKFL